MKKIQPVISEPRKREVLDGSRQQYRCTVEAARQLDGKQSRVQSCEELFQPDLVARRLRLAELCERLALSQPSLYGKKAEDILWRKGHYEVLSTAKNFKKSGSWTPAEKACVERHLLSGIGCYHLWVLRLQAEFQLDLRGMFDMPLPIGDGCLSNNLGSTKSKDQASKDWARQAVHRSLIALGDLIRYLADISPAWTQEQAARCYLQALNIEPMSGMPHNQLGMLSGTQNNNLDAVFHYMRCLCSTEKFAGAEGNLQRALQRSEAVLVRQPDSGRDSAPASPAERVRQCVARILNLAHIWFFDHGVDQDHGQACQVALMELEQCLSLQPSSGTETCNGTEDLTALHKSSDLPYLDDSAVFKIVAVNLLCINQMHTKGSQLVSAAVTFAMAMLSQLSNHAVAKPGEPEEANGHINASNGTHSKELPQKKKRDKKWNRAKMRRRGGDSSEESDQSQEESDSESSSESDMESEGLGSSSEEEEDLEGVPVQQSKANNQPMPRQGILMGAKILFDWLQGDAEMLQTEAGSESVLKVASLVPLPEDVALRGVPILTKTQSTLDWEFLRHNRLHTREEMLLRSYKLVSFGHFLTSANVGVSFDAAAGTFSVREVEQNVKSRAAQASSNGTAKNGKADSNPAPGATNVSTQFYSFSHDKSSNPFLNLGKKYSIYLFNF
ncbi:hypothetical protein B566_EDAN003515 [Ephemera danica]|nr:hypothetical protein B566_EDAN003515 [Ephemera danica]